MIPVAQIADLAADQKELVSRLAVEVELVEGVLEAQMGSRCELVKQVSHSTLIAGGKRLRPALVALAAQAVGAPEDSDRIHKLGACMEMIHMASLIHDDVVDEAPTRRGKPTAAASYGAPASVLSGDVLLAKAMVLLAQDGDLNIIRRVAESVVEMAEGQVREVESRGNFDLSEADCLETLRMKTAGFMQTCCEVGAMATGASDAAVRALGAYGLHLGLAFQITDDLLDYRGDKNRTGKVRATDFREGCATLPLIHLRPLLSERETEAVRKAFGTGEVEEDELRMICQWMSGRGAFDLTLAQADSHKAQALMELEILEPSSSRGLLATLAQYVVARDQ